MSSASRPLLDPALWRLEAARRRHQLQELQAYLSRLETEFDLLQRRVQAFVERYESELGELWQHVEALQSGLQQILSGLSERPLAPWPLRKRAALPQLPAVQQWPAMPSDDITRVAPTLKELHRRAAMRLHPDRAQNESDRLQREERMRAANVAYQNEDRGALEGLLLAAGEAPERLGGFDVHAQWHWLQRCEHLAQGRLRVLRAHQVALQQHPMTQLALAVERAEQRGLAPLAIMAGRLQAQRRELQQQLYIGSRLRPDSALTPSFLAQWRERLGQPA